MGLEPDEKVWEKGVAGEEEDGDGGEICFWGVGGEAVGVVW